MIWFSADTHLSHYNIMKYCNRPFETVEEMDETIIEIWNNNIRQKDTVYLLGDFCFGSNNRWLECRQSLNGDIYLIKGNHDHKKKNKFLESVFGQHRVFDMLEFKRKDLSITLCHYALRVWNKSHYNSYHLFGHSHGMLPGQGKSFDCGVDCNEFCPLSLDEVVAKFESLPDNPNLIKDRKIWN